MTVSDPPPSDSAPERRLIMVFCAGPLGEWLRTVTVPWRDAMGTPGREQYVADLIALAWARLNHRWRFAGALDSRTGRGVLSVPTLGWLGLQRPGGLRAPRVEPAQLATADLDPGPRKLLVLFAAGAIGQYLQSAMVDWDPAFAEPGSESLVLDAVAMRWHALSDTQWFIGALDSHSGDVVLSVAHLGWMALVRMRAHDALALVDDRPDVDDPLYVADFADAGGPSDLAEPSPDPA